MCTQNPCTVEELFHSKKGTLPYSGRASKLPESSLGQTGFAIACLWITNSSDSPLNSTLRVPCYFYVSKGDFKNI